MKKLLAVVIGLAAYSAVYALPVYNPDQPALLTHGVFTCGEGCWGIEAGFRGDYVFDRKLKFDKPGDNVADVHKDTCDYAISTNAGQLTLNLWDRLDVYGWAGAAASEFGAQARLHSSTGFVGEWLNVHGQTKEGFAWGVGARAILWQCGRTAVGVDGQYAHSHANFQCVSSNGIPIQVPTNGADSSRFSLNNSEWQVSLGISHRICWFVPYIAVKYSNFQGKFKGPDWIGINGVFSGNAKFKNRNYVGGVVGISLVDSGKMHVTAEGRFFDERALTVAADFRY
jgi:hypothetical protein